MKCPRCKSENVFVTMSEVGAKTTKHGNGLAGNLNNKARAMTGLLTLGASNMVWKKAKGGEKMKVQNATFGVCQECGNSWKIR